MRDVSSAAYPGESNSACAGIVHYPMQANVVSIYQIPRRRRICTQSMDTQTRLPALQISTLV